MVLSFDDFVNESKKKKAADKAAEEKAPKAENEEKEEKKSTISKEDEEKYLTVGQRKLPDGLKKGIIAKAKKNKA